MEDEIKSGTNESKTFSYSKGNVTLNLTCRVDIEQEMTDLVEILKKSVDDITQEREKRFPK